MICLSITLLGHSLSHYVDLFRKLSLLGPLQIPAGAKKGPKNQPSRAMNLLQYCSRCYFLQSWKRIDLLMHVGPPLAWVPFWYPLIPIGFLLVSFSRIFIDASPPDSANTFLKSGCTQTASIQRCRRSPRRYNESTIDQVAPKCSKKTSGAPHLLGGPGTDLFPESIRIEVFILFVNVWLI